MADRNDSQLLARSLLAPGFVVAQKFGIGPDFKVMTGAIKAFSLPDSPDRPLVRMRGSSTIFDLQNDCMMLSALHSMQDVDPNMTLFLNHSYNLPDDVFAKLHHLPEIAVDGSIADLWLTAEVILRNPPAERTYQMIVQDQVRMGCSIGCVVLEWSFADPDDEWNSPILIHKVQTLEFSVVGIPANQRSWVECGIEGLFGRALVQGQGDEALRLAAAYKSLYPKKYSSVVREVTSAGLKKDLTRVPMRSTSPNRVFYDYPDDTFKLTNGLNRIKSLTRKETDDLFAFPAMKVPLALSNDPEDTEPEGEHGWTVYQKAATGKTSWPLLDNATEWTGSKAEQDIFAWAGGDAFSPAKAKQGFLYCASENQDTRSAYKCPFCYQKGDGLAIVPKGVQACANVLSGGRGGLSGVSDADITSMKTKVKTLYNRINKEQGTDWTVPWESKDEKEDSVGANVTDKQHKEIADSDNAGALNRQDLGEVSAGEVSVREDGTHEACTGTHSHTHKAMGSQGGDEHHSHSHSHEGDANHSHKHAEKSGEETLDKQASVPGGSDTTAEPATEPLTSEPTQHTNDEEAAPGSSSEDGTAQPVTTETPAVPGSSNDTEAILRALDEEAPVLEAKITIWNDLAKSMGLPEYSWNAVKNYLTRARRGEAVDTTQLWDTSSSALTVKEGRTISSNTANVLQGIHDACMSLYPGVCKDYQGNDEAENQGDDHDGDANDTPGTKSVQGEIARTPLLLSVDQDRIKQAVQEVVTEYMKGLTSMIQNAFTGLMDHMVSNLGVLHEKQKGVEAGILKTKGEMLALTEQTARLAKMPMGRPTQITRSVDASGAATGYAATYQDMVNAGQQGSVAPNQAKKLADLEALTNIVAKQMPPRNGIAPTMQYRQWPAGVGAPVDAAEGVTRPPLTPQQSIYMVPSEWDAYNNGETASVPLIDDPFEQ